MAYATRQDLIDRFGATEIVQRTDRTNRPPTTIDDTVVGRAIGDAEALIDGYLAGRYELPLAVVPAALPKICCDLARFHLWGSAADKDGAVARAADAATAWLKDVARGTVALEVGGAPAAAPVGGGGVRSSVSTRRLDRDSLRGM